MTIVRWEPLRELSSLQSDMNRLFNAMFDAPAGGGGQGQLRRWTPAMDLAETTGEGFYRVERTFGAFSRSLTLPKGVDAEAIAASFNDGVLEVRIPKPEERKPRRIAINGEQRELEAEA